MESIDLDAPDDPPLLHQARFQADRRGRLVGDRSFNATAIGRALLGEQLLGVAEDPDSANRQIARLKGDLYLETTVTGRRQESPSTDSFLADIAVAAQLSLLRFPSSAGSALAGKGVPGLSDHPKLQPLFQWRDQIELKLMERTLEEV